LFWIVWCLLLAVWTVGLLLPEGDEVVNTGFVGRSPVPVGKALHFVAYAVLAYLAASRGVWWLLAGLGAHGAATEALQTLVPGRDGSLRDVLIDSAGVAVGAALGWWRSRPPGKTS